MTTNLEIVCKSVGYNEVGKLVVRASTVPTGATLPHNQRQDIEIPTDHITFAKLAEMGMRIYNDTKYREKRR